MGFGKVVRNTGLRRVMLGGLLASCLWAFGAAAALPVADEQAIQQVKLDDGLFGRLAAVKKDGEALGVAQDIIDPASLTTLDSLSRAMLSVDPRVAGVLSKHGFSGRQYAASMIALIRATAAVQMAGTPYGAAALKGTSATNVAWAKAHLSQIQALNASDDD